MWKQSQPQCWPEWYLHNSIFLWIRWKVCLDAPSDCWTVEPEAEVKTAQSRVTKIQWQRWTCMTVLVKNDSGRAAAEVFMETTDEYKVLRPIERAKINKKSHSYGKRSIAWEKLVFPSLVAWRVCTKIRDAPAEKRRKSQVQRSSTRTEMLFFWFFSAPNLCETHGLNTWSQ